VQSHLRLHGLDPVADLIELDIDPAGSETLADALNAALSHADGEVALVVLPGVQFLTGHVLPVASLCAVAHQHGARIGLDLAHSIGNVVVELDQADADFAVWCSYKYLNAGPGAIGGCWVHSRWHDAGLPRFEGWWGHAKERRFELEARFRSIGTMEAWQLSNPPILAMAPLEASLESFAAAGFGRLCAKSAALTGYLQRLIESTFDERITVLTPPAADARGCQLSLRLNLGQRSPADFVARLDSANVTADWRAPDILRLAPVPLYNSFLDVHRAVAAIDQALGN
jgi:kynureninase